MKTIDIKGKAYVEVNERIKFFRENHEGGRILTDIVSIDNGVCVIKAYIYIGETLVATGHAYEKEGSTFINKTSYIENCETSAVGRALGILGIGIDTSIASAEEVGNAVIQQNNDDVSNTQTKFTAASKKVGSVSKLYDKIGLSKDEVLKIFKANDAKGLKTLSSLLDGVLND